MSTKAGNLNELSNILRQKDGTLLSNKDVKDLFVSQLYRQMTDEQMYHKMNHIYD